MNPFVLQGFISYFDSASLVGLVQVGGKAFVFNYTDFDSGRPTRYPISGEDVDVVFVGDYQLLSVRAP